MSTGERCLHLKGNVEENTLTSWSTYNLWCFTPVKWILPYKSYRLILSTLWGSSYYLYVAQKKNMSTDLWVILTLSVHVLYTKVNNRNKDKYTSLFKNSLSAVGKAIIFLGHNVHSWGKKFTHASQEPLSSCIPTENLWALHQKQGISSCVRIIGFPLILRKLLWLLEERKRLWS